VCYRDFRAEQRSRRLRSKIQVVADRSVRCANMVRRENVIAGTDCGFGGRIHPHIAWAKLAALVQGAKLATEELWR